MTSRYAVPLFLRSLLEYIVLTEEHILPFPKVSDFQFQIIAIYDIEVTENSKQNMF